MSESLFLEIHKVAAEDGRPRVRGRHPDTGADTLLDPYTGQPSPKPLAGIRLRTHRGPKDPPRVTGVSTTLVAQGQSEGWLELVNPRVVTAPGGPAANPLAKVHTFVQADKVVFKTLDGDVVYRVTRNPGKYDASGEPTQAAGDPTAEVLWDYRLELEEG